MKQAKIACAFLLLSLAIISGCWDQKAIQDLIYLTGIGVDFENNEYVIYAQSSDLASVAKQEPSGATESPPAVISIGRGETLQSALDNLQKNAQIPLFGGFVSTLIFHERILKKGIFSTFDILNRYGLLRYTKWVFGTREPIDKVMSDHTITGFSPLTSMLHQPLDVYRQRSFIEPIRYFTFVSRFWEPGNTVLLPNITIYTHSWKENNRFITRLNMDGVHPIHRGKWIGFIPNQNLLGVRWLTPKTEFAGLIIREGKKPKATLRVKHVSLDISPVQKGVDPRFRVTVHLRAFVRDMMGDVSAEYIKKNAEKQIEQQIRSTFLKGIASGADLYGLEETLYRKDIDAWKQFAKDHSRTLTENALDAVDVHVYLSDSGKMKLNWYDYPKDLLP